MAIAPPAGDQSSSDGSISDSRAPGEVGTGSTFFMKGSAGSGAVGGIPRFIGHYHIKRLIGHGGMGAVYEAVQEQPRRVVALKVMRTGAASRSAFRRFAYESQLLARLRHPYIAQVFEAGTHIENGVRVPFFAMEYVAGATYLTEYAERKDLTTDQRIELFIKVCDAVHHGHQKGIVHRDLKPQNILVDTDGRPKVIDFGVARATDSDMAVTTQQTDVGSLVGTLQYMSPEQVAADPHDIDTRSDVYALGVVLYELACRKLPYDCSKCGIPEAVRMVREQPPARPTSVSAFVKRDLEVILLKALEKDRDRRYRSAADFADDLRRYLSAEPVSARPASIAYQLKLFAKRNRTAVVAAGIVFAALIAATTISTWMALSARKDNAKLKQFATFTDFALGSRDGKDEINLSLEQASRIAHATFGDDPAAEARVRITIAQRYFDKGNFRSAAAEATAALALESAPLRGADPIGERVWTAAALYSRARLADTESGAKGVSETLDLLAPLLKDWKAIPNQDLRAVLAIMDLYAVAWMMRDDLARAADSAADRVEAGKRFYPDSPHRWIRPLHNLSLIEARLGKAVNARQHFEAAHQHELNTRRAGLDDSLGERDALTAYLWPANARVGVASPAVLDAINIEVPPESEPPAYTYERAAKKVREFLAGRQLFAYKREGQEPFTQTMKREIAAAWLAYCNHAASHKQRPTPEGLRPFIDNNPSWFELQGELQALDQTIEEIERLPLRRTVRWNALRPLLDRLCPESADGSTRLFTIDELQIAICDPESPALLHRRAWRVLGNPRATEAEFKAAESLARRAALKQPARADYIAAVGVGLFRIGDYASADETLRKALAMVHESPDNMGRCGEEVPLVFQATVNLRRPSTRTLGYILLGQARTLIPRGASPMSPEQARPYLLCDLSSVGSALAFERETYRAYLDEAERLGSTGGVPSDQSN